MKSYQYKAIDEQGKFYRGKIDAINNADLEMRLRKMGLDLINYRNIKSPKKGLAKANIKRRDLITFCFHMEQTTKAEVPMLSSLQDLRDSTENPQLKEIIAEIIELIEGGKTLSGAMRSIFGAFDAVFINLVAAGEQSGRLDTVFNELGKNLKWQDEQIAQTKKLFIYPSLVLIIVFAVVFFLMTYLVPELLQFIKTMGQDLALHTRALIFVSNIFVHYWYIILALPVVLVLFVRVGIKTSRAFHLKYDHLMLKLPIMGPILKKIILSRIANFFALMYASGITIIECIKTSESIAGNKVIEGAMRQAGQQIADGVTLSDSFQHTGLFPPLVLRMVRVGENIGALENALKNISYFYTRDVKESIEQLQSIIEPTITVVLGAIIVWVMFSVLGPIYVLIAQIKI